MPTHHDPRTVDVDELEGELEAAKKHPRWRPSSTIDDGETGSKDSIQKSSSASFHDIAYMTHDIQPLPTNEHCVRGTPGAHAVAGGFHRSRYSTGVSHCLAAPHTLREDEEITFSANVVEETIESTEMGGSGALISLDDHVHSDGSQLLQGIEVFEGKHMAEGSVSASPSYASKWPYLVVVLIAIAATVVTVLGMVIPDIKEDKSTLHVAGNSSSLSPTVQIHYPPFQDDLPVDIVVAMENVDSPEARANVWMWNDPYLGTYTAVRQRQRFAYVVFYFSTGGDNWFRNDNWLDYEISECSWYSSFDPNNNNAYPATFDGENICDENELLQIFDLHANNLSGLMPGLSQAYPSLRYLDVSDNFLHGPPPPLLVSKCRNLSVFIVSNNHLEGALIGDAGFVALHVRVVKLDGNFLSGNLNPVFQVLPQLEVLNMTSNRFAMNVAPELQYTTRLTYLGLAENQLVGTLPSELGALTNLRTMDLSGNADLTGVIPAEWGSLTELTQLDVSDTALTGTIPSSMCTSSRLLDSLEIDANWSRITCD